MVVFNTLNWADVEEITEMNWIQVDQDLECCLLAFSGDDGSKSSDKPLELLVIEQFKAIWRLHWL